MTDDDNPISDYNIGFHSPHYMLQALVAHADEDLLRAGVIEMINYLVHNDDPDLGTAFDLLAQVCASGVYVRTYEHDPEEEEHPNRDLDPTTRAATAIIGTEPGESTEDILKRFREQLNIIPETDEEGDK